MPRDLLPYITRAIRNAAHGDLPPEILEEQSLVFDLGFDSLAIARLSLTLEQQLGSPILLDSWLSLHTDPVALTVGSLCAFVRSRG